MSLQISIVGLPNVGKSTLFKALTKKDVLIENYPFATIDPNVGVVQVPDERLDLLSAMSRSEKTIPTVIEFVDVAGLVKNAHQGEGLGNKFLAQIREVDAILHLVRAFEDSNIHHVEGSIDPGRDEDTVKLELIMADMTTIDKRITAVEAKTKSGDKEMLAQLATIKKAQELLASEQWLADKNWGGDEIKILRQANLLTMKPVIHVINKKQPTSGHSGLVPESSESLKQAQANIITLDVKEELELSGLSNAEKKEIGLEKTGLENLIRLAYKTLDLITFLTTGPKESRAWTIQQGTTAPAAAGVIHTDFQQKFIKAEVINWQDLLHSGSWTSARDSGLIRTEGKEYVVQDGDVIIFKI